MENEMGTQKVSRLIMTTGIPLMLSLLINSLYNFVDSVFVSRVAEDALTALQGLSLARPSMVLTVLRQAILPVLLVFVLGKTGQMMWVWAAFPAAEALCIPLARKLWNRSYTSVEI